MVWRSGNTVRHISEVTLRLAWLSAGTGDRLYRACLLGKLSKPPRPTEPPNVSRTGTEHQTKDSHHHHHVRLLRVVIRNRTVMLCG